MSPSKFQSILCPHETVTGEQLETERRIVAFDKKIPHLNRRGFLGAMMAAAAASTLTPSAHAQTATVSVVDVLNFALNLEYLEANFYLYATTGAGLTAAQNGGGVAVTGAPAKLALDTNTMAVAQALANDEVNHIAGLRAAITSLGGTPVAQPAINLSANGAVTTQAMFLAAARQFTALGGSAYVGSAQLLVSNPTVLTTAGQILGAEGQHAGVLAYLCVANGVTSPAIDAQDVPPTNVAPTLTNLTTPYITVDSVNALSPSRNTSQVLGVAYRTSTATTLNPATGTTMGGFFPSGFNGNVKST